MRLDRFLTESLGLTRSQAGRIIRSGEVLVNGMVTKSAATQVGEQDVVAFDGQMLQQIGPRYFMLHKPEGYVCSNDDPEHPTVLMLFDEPALGKLHCAGRLDLDTTGLLLVTDDGQARYRNGTRAGLDAREMAKRHCVQVHQVGRKDGGSPRG